MIDDQTKAKLLAMMLAELLESDNVSDPMEDIAIDGAVFQRLVGIGTEQLSPDFMNKDGIVHRTPSAWLRLLAKAVDKFIQKARPPQKEGFRWRYQILGGHAHIRVYAGRLDCTYGCCGDLSMRVEEWSALQASLAPHENHEFVEEKT